MGCFSWQNLSKSAFDLAKTVKKDTNSLNLNYLPGRVLRWSLNFYAICPGSKYGGILIELSDRWPDR
jgi:hypothetical protein